MSRLSTAFSAVAIVATILLSGTAGFAHQSTLGVQTASAGQAHLSPSDKVLAQLESRRAEKAFSAYLTGYSYWDNTPPGSAAISKPVIHRRAGGTGKYNDPITIVKWYF